MSQSPLPDILSQSEVFSTEPRRRGRLPKSFRRGRRVALPLSPPCCRHRIYDKRFVDKMLWAHLDIAGTGMGSPADDISREPELGPWGAAAGSAGARLLRGGELNAATNR